MQGHNRRGNQGWHKEDWVNRLGGSWGVESGIPRMQFGDSGSGWAIGSAGW